MKNLPAKNGIGKITLNTDLTVAALVALNYCNAGGRIQPKPGWGYELTADRIAIGSDIYTCTNRVEEIDGVPTNGVFLVKHVNGLNGSQTYETFWFPLEAIKNATIIIEGIKL